MPKMSGFQATMLAKSVVKWVCFHGPCFETGPKGLRPAHFPTPVGSLTTLRTLADNEMEDNHGSLSTSAKQHEPVQESYHFVETVLSGSGSGLDYSALLGTG